MEGRVKAKEMEYKLELERQKGDNREDISHSSNKTVKLLKLDSEIFW